MSGIHLTKAVSITSRETDSMRLYLKDVAKFSPLTQEDEVMLVNKYRNGDIDAFHTLINSNLRFVISVAKLYQNRGLSLEDLIAEGNMGLMAAIDKFDINSGNRFVTFAVWHVRQAIMQAIDLSGGAMKISGNGSALLREIKKIQSQFEQNEQRMPTVYEIADILKTSTDKICEILSSTSTATSLDAPLKDDDDCGFVGDTIADSSMGGADSNLNHAEFIENLIHFCKQHLKARDAEIVLRLFGVGYPKETVSSLAFEYGMTETRINQIRNTAIENLRSCKGVTELAAYLV